MPRTKQSRKVVSSRSLGRVVFDNGMYLVALITPILTLPQVFLIWSAHQTAGVSIITWGAYGAMSGIWLIYGLLQHQKPLIVSQACLFIVDFAVVLGVAMTHS